MHDYNPGIASNGLFWTIPVPPDAGGIDLARGTAFFHMTRVAIPDFHDFFNSLGFGNPPVPVVPGYVSFDTRWHATGPLVGIRDVGKHFVGEFRDSVATIAWSASTPAQHFHFVSDPRGTTRTIGAAIGHERNGEFFT